MNVGDFSTVFAAQTALVRARRAADSERFEAEVAARRSEKRERAAAELSLLAPVAASRKVADGKNRNETNGNVEKSGREREKDGAFRDSRRLTRLDFSDVGARIDVFC